MQLPPSDSPTKFDWAYLGPRSNKIMHISEALIDEKWLHDLARWDEIPTYWTMHSPGKRKELRIVKFPPDDYAFILRDQPLNSMNPERGIQSVSHYCYKRAIANLLSTRLRFPDGTDIPIRNIATQMEKKICTQFGVEYTHVYMQFTSDSPRLKRWNGHVAIQIMDNELIHPWVVERLAKAQMPALEVVVNPILDSQAVFHDVWARQDYIDWLTTKLSDYLHVTVLHEPEKAAPRLSLEY